MSLRLYHEDLVGNDVIAVTQSQLNRLKKAHEAGKGVTIKMFKSQVAHNMKIQGGFLPLLAGLACQALPFFTGTILPALGVGALSETCSVGERLASASKQNRSTDTAWQAACEQQ